MQLGDGRHEPKPETTARGGPGCVAAKEGVKEFRQIVLRNAGSNVGDAERRAGRTARALDLDANTWRRIDQRVIETIGDHLGQELAVALQGQRLVEVDNERSALLFGAGRKASTTSRAI
jgi:hypothetical protein